MNELISILMEKFDYDRKEAIAEIKSAIVQLHEYIDSGDNESAHDICEELWGLEPDYLVYLI